MPTRTFLFVDQVGSTEQLSLLGDQAGHAVRTALFDLLRQASELAGGEEVDFTGDGLFCAFEGAAEAVDAAVAMQQLVWSFNRRRSAEVQLGIRVGINTGEPLESASGGYFGVAVVIAARLCSVAAAGEILVAEVVSALVGPRGVHRFNSVGPRSLKGIDQPVTVFSVAWEPDERVAPLPRMLAASRSGPFVGREQESSAVMNAWESVLAGGRRLVLISGDSGIGCTRFAAEMAYQLTADGAMVWSGGGEGAHSRLAAWSEAVLEWAEQSSRAEVRLALGGKAAEFLRLAPGIGRLFPRLPAPPPMDAKAEVFLIADALDELVARYTEQQPLVMVFDRVEEADQASLIVLRRLLESPRSGRILILASYEPSQVGARRVLTEFGQVPGVVDLRLTGLDRAEVRELMSEVSGEPASDSAVSAVLAESEGSPYFVLQMATAVKAGRITRSVTDAVGRAAELRTDLRLQREEIVLGLRQLDQLRAIDPDDEPVGVEPDGTPPADIACPYKGLLSFGTPDAADFFGRELQIAELIARLLSNRFLAVVGPSGSGKSSIIRAGLLPALAGGAIPGSETWSTIVWTPSDGPLPGLTALAQAGPVDGRVVLVVDQAEQLWTITEPGLRAATLDSLVSAVTDNDERVVVVLVMRADYYGHAAEHPGLAQLIADSQLLLSPMTHAELRSSIEGPARRVGLLLEPGLAQAVIDDIGDEPGGLPLLSTALLETWERRRGRTLTLSGYAETGGARRAIAQLADTTYDELSEAEQDAARRLLLRLAAPTAAGDDVARPTPLAGVTGDPTMAQVLSRLTERRLVTVDRSTVQVAHEALLREWPRYRAWLDADREGRRLQHQISTAAVDWDTGGRAEETLLRGARLAAAADWHSAHTNDLTETENTFLTASLDARQGELRRARRTARRFQLLSIGLVVLLISALAAGGFALKQQQTAEEQRQIAVQNGNKSDARGLAAQAVTLADKQSDTALLLAVEGYRRDPSPDTEYGLLAALNGARSLVQYHRNLPQDTYDIAVTPDGKTLAVLTASGDLHTYDTSTWATASAPLVSGIASPISISTSRDGNRVFFGAGDGGHVIDLNTGQPIGGTLGDVLTGRGSFSRSGSTLVSDGFRQSGEPTGTQVFDVGTGRALVVIEPNLPAVFDVSPLDDVVAMITNESSTIRRYRLDGAPLDSPVALPEEVGEVRSLQYSPDGSRLLLTGERVSQFINAETLAPEGKSIVVAGTQISDTAISASGKSVAISADDGSVLIAESSTGDVQSTLLGMSGASLIEFLGDERLLAMTVAGEALEYDLTRATALGTSWSRGTPVGQLRNGDGGSVLISDRNRVFRTELTAGEMRDTAVLLESAHPQPMSVSEDRSLVAVYGEQTTDYSVEDGRINILELPTGRVRQSVAIKPGSNSEPFTVGEVALSPDTTKVAVSTRTGQFVILDLPSGKQVIPQQVIAGTQASDFTWSSDSTTVVVAAPDGVVRLYNADSGALTNEIPLTAGLELLDVAPVPGTTLLAFASVGSAVYFVDMATGKLDGQPLTADGVLQIAFTPDGRRVAAVSRDGAVRLWDTASRRALGPPLKANETGLGSVVFTDDQTLVTGDVTGQLTSWEMSPDGWIQRACELAGRALTEQEWTQYLPDQPYRQTCALS